MAGFGQRLKLEMVSDVLSGVCADISMVSAFYDVMMPATIALFPMDRDR